MGIQSWSEHILTVELPKEPELTDELQAVINICYRRGDCSVVVDFRHVNVITSMSLAKLLKLRKILVENDMQLVLCGMNPRTLHIFRLTGLVDVFCLAKDKFTALTNLQMTCDCCKELVCDFYY